MIDDILGINQPRSLFFLFLIHFFRVVISKGFFEEFKEGESFYKSMFNPPFYHMNLWHYPSNPERGQFGIGQHTGK